MENQPQIDWEALLANEGMPEELAPDAIPSGDALDVARPDKNGRLQVGTLGDYRILSSKTNP